MRALRPFLPIGFAVALAAAVLGITAARALSLNGGINYALDDAYIHLAMAKNLAAHGNWGVDAHEFSGSSSSPLWTLFLAASFLLFGPDERVPLVANALLCVAVLWRASSWARRSGVSDGSRAALLAVVVLATPFVALVFGGMEHLAHACATLWLVEVAARVASDSAAATARAAAACAVLAAVTCGLRYEGAFAVIVAAVALLRHHWRVAVTVVAAGAAPILVLAACSVAHGWPAIPAPILLKTQGVTPWERLGANLAQPLTGTMVLLLVVACALLLPLLVAARGRVDAAVKVAAAMFIAIAVLHLGTARVGWFLRYEAYLVALGTVVVVIGATAAHQAFVDRGSRYALVIGTAALCGVLPLSARAAYALRATPRAIANIHDQQLRMSRFIQRSLPGASLALNDVGAAAWYTDARIVDTAGLTSRAVAEAVMSGKYTAERLQEIVTREGVEVALVYDSWLPRSGRLQWRKVTEWRIADNVVCGSDTVSIYAVSPSVEAQLRAAVRSFEADEDGSARRNAPTGNRTARGVGATAGSLAEPSGALR